MTPPSCLEGSNDSIDKLFVDGNDDEPEHPTVGDDDVLVETIAKDVSKKLREDYHAATFNIGGKSLAIILSLIPEGSSVSIEILEPCDDGLTDSVSGLNLWTRPPSMRCSVVDAPVMTVAVTTTIAANVSVVLVSKNKVRSGNLEKFRDFASPSGANANVASSLKLNKPVTNDSILDDLYGCRDLTDRLALLALFSQLHVMDYDYLYTEFNDKTERKIYLMAEVRMRAEHTLDQKDKLKDKCAEQAALLSKKDAEIANLKSLLSLKEAEAAVAIRLRDQLCVAKAIDVAKGNKLRGLKEKNLALEEEKSVLSKKVTTFESVTVAKETELASLFAQLLEMAAHLEEKFYPRFLTTIYGRRWILSHGLKLVLLKCLQSSKYLCILGEAIGCAINKGMHDGLKAGVDHETARRDLSVIEAYDPSIEAEYVDAVNALHTMDFSLLSVLKSKKDACMADLMDSLCLEGTLAEIPGAEELQPSLEQLMLPIHRAKDDVVLGETSISFSFQYLIIKSWTQNHMMKTLLP
nr:hypothetical protein [Tanacetum cinerariifolium]